MAGRTPLRILLAVLGLALGAGAVASPVAAQVAAPAAQQQRTMPAVVGMDAGPALSRLREMGMQVTVREVASSRARGTVVAQQPEAGTVIQRGMTAVLGVSSGPRTAPPDTAGGGITVRPPRQGMVPDLTGMPLRLARIRLLASGLRAGAVDSGRVDGAIPGRVIAQDPRPGTQAEPGTSVRLTLQKRPAAVPPPADSPSAPPVRRRVAVPDVTGRTVAQARTVIGGARLLLGGVDSTVTADGPPGTIVRQRPEAGDSVEPGTFVAVTTAREALVVVPRVVGRPPSEARRALARAELRPGSIREREAPGAVAVLSQSVPAGTRVRPGTVVDLVISRAPVVPADTPRTGGPAPVPAPPPVVDSVPIAQPESASTGDSVVVTPPVLVAPPPSPAPPPAAPASPPPAEPATRTVPWPWLAIVAAALLAIVGGLYVRSRVRRRAVRRPPPVVPSPVPPIVTVRASAGESHAGTAPETPVGKGRVRIGVIVGDAIAPQPQAGEAALTPVRVTVQVHDGDGDALGAHPERVVEGGAVEVRVTDAEPVLARDEGNAILKGR